MCKYRYAEKGSNIYDKPCIYPDFFSENNEKFIENLPIDKDGYCIFHSKNNKWKIDNNFKGWLFELLKVISEININLEKHKREYFFSGFCFPNYDSFKFDKLQFIGSVDLSNCTFNCRVEFLNMSITSLNIQHTTFNEKLYINNVDFENSIFSSNATFHKGLSFINCDLQRNLLFINCTFNNKDETSYCEIAIKQCKSVHYLSFEGSIIKPTVSIRKSSFDYELNFNHCIIENEFLFEQSQINGTISFIETEFTLKENVNPMMSSTHFENIKISEKGKIIFKGKRPQDEMIKNELSIHFKDKPKGLISFENFNLNKIYPKFKARLFELEKEGIVEIGKGCRKYYCQTDVITIEASNSNQKLILDIVTVFCNYFEIQQGFNLGIEIIERTKSQIKYFYFTDEVITKEDFIERIKQNENSLWQTFSNLATNASEIISKNDIEIKSCLIDIAGLFLKMGNQIEHNNLSENDFNNIFNSITVNSKSIIDTLSLLKEIQQRWNNFNENVPILIIENMGNKYINYGNVEQFGENNYKTIITDNSNITDEQKNLIFETIEEIKKEPEPDKKESKLTKFIKDFGPTIGEAAVKMISAVV